MLGSVVHPVTHVPMKWSLKSNARNDVRRTAMLPRHRFGHAKILGSQPMMDTVLLLAFTMSAHVNTFRRKIQAMIVAMFVKHGRPRKQILWNCILCPKDCSWKASLMLLLWSAWSLDSVVPYTLPGIKHEHLGWGTCCENVRLHLQNDKPWQDWFEHVSGPLDFHSSLLTRA